MTWSSSAPPGLRDVRAGHGGLRAPHRAGRDLPGDPAGQQVYRRDRPLGPGQGAWSRTATRLAHVLYNLLEATRICGILLLPLHAGELRQALCPDRRCPGAAATWDSAGRWGVLPEGGAVTKGENLFPRHGHGEGPRRAGGRRRPSRPEGRPAAPWRWSPSAEEKVDFDTFCKSDFRAVKVKDCQAVKKSEKLLRFTLDDGTGTDRQILSGIHKFYEPEELIGKTLVAIVNLPPRKMMGQESCGMLHLRRPHREGRGEAPPASWWTTPSPPAPSSAEKTIEKEALRPGRRASFLSQKGAQRRRSSCRANFSSASRQNASAPCRSAPPGWFSTHCSSASSRIVQNSSRNRSPSPSLSQRSAGPGPSKRTAAASHTWRTGRAGSAQIPSPAPP